MRRVRHIEVGTLHFGDCRQIETAGFATPTQKNSEFNPGGSDDGAECEWQGGKRENDGQGTAQVSDHRELLSERVQLGLQIVIGRGAAQQQQSW